MWGLDVLCFLGRWRWGLDPPLLPCFLCPCSTMKYLNALVNMYMDTQTEYYKIIFVYIRIYNYTRFFI